MAAVYRRVAVMPLSLRCWRGSCLLKQPASKTQNFTSQVERLPIRQCSTKPSVVQPKSEVELADNKRLRKDLDDSHVPSEYQRRILVHFKYFPNLDSVPERVSIPLMARAMSQARIKVSISMMAIALILCFFTALYGKTHMRETSLVEVNMRRHEAYKMGSSGSGGRLALVFNPKKEEDESKSE